MTYAYKSQGRYAEAEPLYQHTFAISEKRLSPDHPYVAQPTAKKAGIDLRIKGRDSLTYYMYTVLPQLIGQSFFEDLLQRFQNMMIYLDHKSYHRFFDPIFNERYPQLANKEEQKTLDFLLWPIKVGHTTVGYDLIDQLEQQLSQSHGAGPR